MSTRRKAIVVAIDSDIGAALAERWLERGVVVAGTYLQKSEKVELLERSGAQVVVCDLASTHSVNEATARLREICPGWEATVMCPGALEPIGGFEKNSMDEWERSVLINFVRQVRLVHGLLPARASTTLTAPTVIWFAGGGVNSAPVNYSAYTVSKIALIKMAELLDAEMADVCFTVIGPGWVKTKIHEATLRAGEQAGDNWQRTKDMLAREEMTSMERVLDCVDWVVGAPREAVGGRNISVAHDKWGSGELQEALRGDNDMYKLRRRGN